MGYSASGLLPLGNPISMHDPKKILNKWCKSSIFPNPKTFDFQNSHFHRLVVLSCVNGGRRSGTVSVEEAKYKWVKRSVKLDEEQKQLICQLPPKMTNRSKALMTQIICYSTANGSIPLLLSAWVKSTKPKRADWLSVLKELDRLNHPLYFKVAEHALTEESFEANVRDYTKLIHNYAKQNRLTEAEQTLSAIKARGFVCDQVTLTALVHMYSKAGNLKLAESSFEEMKLLGVPLDKRSYGSLVMAYIRAGMLDHGEKLLQEMEAQEIRAGREVYKALLRAYSMMGDSAGAQRVFDAIQLAGISPDVKVCGLLINAYVASGRAREAYVAFYNMKKVGIEPNDKCVALVLGGYAKENRLKEALEFLVELERESVVIGKEASEILAKWFRELGVVEEVELALRDLAIKIPTA